MVEAIENEPEPTTMINTQAINNQGAGENDRNGAPANTDRSDLQNRSQVQAENEKNKRNEIRIFFLGDEGVGKTSIIHSIVTERFPKNVNKTFKTTVLDSDLYLLETDIKTVLVDSSTSKDHVQ